MKKVLSLILILLMLVISGCKSNDEPQSALSQPVEVQQQEPQSEVSQDTEKEETKQEETKQEETKQEETKQEETKQEEKESSLNLINLPSVDIKDTLQSIATTRESLGLTGNYTELTDIPDTYIDENLLKVWKNGNSTETITYSSDGKYVKNYELFTDYTEEYTFTNVKLGYYDIIIVKSPENESLEYYVYKIDNGVLYLADLPADDKEFASEGIGMMIWYQADDKESVEYTIKCNPISIESLYGTWESNDFSMTISDKGALLTSTRLNYGNKPYIIEIDENNRLKLDLAGNVTSYDYALILKRLQTKDNYSLDIQYTGKDVTERPNLINDMVDWNRTYEIGFWLYTLSLNLK